MNDVNEQAPPQIDTSPEQLLQDSQRIRKQLVDQMVGEGVPTDKAERRLLLQALADMDQTSIQRVRNDIGQQSVDNDRQAQQIVEQLYQTNPRGLRNEHPVDRPLPQCQLPHYDHVDGETHVGISNEDSSGFLERMDGDQNSA